MDAARRTKWPTIVAMVLLLAATAAGWYWVWGVFFLYWAVYGILMGQAFVVQAVVRQEHPVLFWFISITWVALAALTIVYDISPQVIPESSAVRLRVTNE